jgi:hypothetical protein
VPLTCAQAGQLATRSEIDGFAADVMMQAVLVWVRAQTGFASLPSGIGEMRWYRELPAGGDYYLSLKVTSKTDAACTCAVTMHDAAGVAYLAATGLNIVINKTLSFSAGGAVGADEPLTKNATSFEFKGSALSAEIDYQRAQGIKYKATGKPLLWDFDDLLMWAEGDVTSPVFNKHKSGVHPPWEVIDGYKRRVRLPQREYLLCSRVTKMQATTNVWEKSTMTTEYDLPINGELSEGGDIPWAVLVESGQCDLMLIAYLGVDFQCKSERVYRLLDTTLTFHGVAKEGQTLEYDIQINSFARQEGQVTMFFFEYNCYVDGKLLIEMRNGVAGFFTDKELADGKGVIWTGADQKVRAKAFANQKDVSPYMLACDNKPTFADADMQKLSEAGHMPGTWASVLGPSASDV